MITFALFVSMLVIAALASVLLHILARIDGLDRRVDSIADGDWSDADTDRIERSAKGTP